MIDVCCGSRKEGAAKPKCGEVNERTG